MPTRTRDVEGYQQWCTAFRTGSRHPTPEPSGSKHATGRLRVPTSFPASTITRGPNGNGLGALNSMNFQLLRVVRVNETQSADTPSALTSRRTTRASSACGSTAASQGPSPASTQAYMREPPPDEHAQLCRAHLRQDVLHVRMEGVVQPKVRRMLVCPCDELVQALFLGLQPERKLRKPQAAVRTPHFQDRPAVLLTLPANMQYSTTPTPQTSTAYEYRPE